MRERPIISKRLVPLVLLWLAGACLRLTVLAIPPVVPLLHADLHLTETGIGWLSSLPPMMFAIAAVPGALLIARFGVIPALLVGLLLNAVGAAARGAIADATSLYASTIVMAAGVSIMQPSLPPLVRSWFPDRIGFATAIYTNGLLVGEIVVVALTIPFVLPLVGNSWRLNFVVWAIPVLATALLVALCAPKPVGVASDTTAAKPRWWPDWKDPLIWKLGLILGSVNTAYFVTNAFLPDYVIAAGRPDLVSPALTAINLGQLPASFLMLAVAGRLVTKPWAYVVTGLICLLSTIGMMMMTGAWIVFWAGLLGFTNAITLILALALPSVLSAPNDVHRSSAGMFTVSYSCAMAISVLGGWLWDATHLPLAGLAPVAVCELAVIALASTVKRADRRLAPA
ncbi:MAG TPA: MFS transporter [Xanthobacteraceae bacterium]|nr:MFS transporter [Xanthobacteraceae bacterium]